MDVDDGAGVGTGEHRLAEFAGMARQMNGQGDLEATMGSVMAEALDGRNLIGQAQGILMERYQVDADQAFNVLRRYSSHSNRKLRHIADDVVQSRLPPVDPASEDHEPRPGCAPTDGAAAGAFTQRGRAGTTGEGRK